MELAPGKPRYSPAAREELICRLTQYHDATGTPITLVFDGSRPLGETDDGDLNGAVEILYSRAGQTADQLIERMAYRLHGQGEVLVVTNDITERETVAHNGTQVSSCANFIRMIESCLENLEREIQNYNRQERTKFLRHS
jgi:hypothetical protein